MKKELQTLTFFQLKKGKPKELAKKLHWYMKKRTDVELFEDKVKRIKYIAQGLDKN